MWISRCMPKVFFFLTNEKQNKTRILALLISISII